MTLGTNQSLQKTKPFFELATVAEMSVLKSRGYRLIAGGSIASRFELK